MIEPWVTWWSSIIYRRLHHEPFDADSVRWEFPASGPLSGANIALPWIIFHRDRQRFEREYPLLTVRCIRPTLPFRYLLSGGVSCRSIAPLWTFGLARRIEECLNPWMRVWGMFAQIVVEKRTGIGAESAIAEQ